tara:strand:- start:145 stop:465 length:321 start_codon:yes stop_codon:yes gene_type:complete
MAIEEANMTRNVNSEKLLTSIATSNGVLEFIIISGLTIERVSQVIIRYNKTVTPRPVNIAVGIISLGFLTSSPNVASLEYPVKAKNQILAESKILSKEILLKTGIA